MLTSLYASPENSLYLINSPERSAGSARYIASTPETRSICNDPFVLGVQYTRLLQRACTKILQGLREKAGFKIYEEESIVFHILRGGLNFGLRTALADAYGWNRHGSAFISAQRARVSHNSEDWHITESDYKKVYIPQTATAVFGDVVASGTSLKHALQELLATVEKQGAQLRSILFFTFGGDKSEIIMDEIDRTCRSLFEGYEGSVLVYLEGRFMVPTPETPLSIKVTGTDLLRRDSLLPPEFIESQYEDPSYPIERCTIYDAGSRACWVPEYRNDLLEYWTQTLQLAEDGMTYTQLLQERFPSLDAHRFAKIPDLAKICRRQLDKARKL
jgi:hypothetical protein